ncbi:hypothetical protein VE03_01376 [Pseudogymnoascus sp. 23342-1-I1]|nr:hypothetical protein VE03_01376 [Pseudogymnoascus sp. 23342-1-I1]
MARSRFPAPWAITQLFFRIVSVGLSSATFVIAIYCSAKYGYGSAMVGSFIASIWAIAVDAPEVAGLLDSTRRTRRCTDGYIVFLSVATMLICALVPVAVQIAVLGTYHECGGKPADVCREEERLRDRSGMVPSLAFALPCVVAGLHLFFSIIGCVGLCTRKRND